MAKIVTEKSQIPKRYQKKIKNFNKLTPNQAIYEYELIKLQRRAGKEYKDYIQLEFERPKRVSQSDIKRVHEFRGIKLKKAKSGVKPKAIDYNYPALIKGYHHYTEKEKAEYDKTHPQKEDYSWLRDYDYDYTPDYSWDLEEEASQELAAPGSEKTYESPEQYLKETGQRIDPNTDEVVPYESPEEYLKDTNQTVDPNTGEVIDRDIFIANQMELILEFFDELKQSVRNSASNAIISNSSYKNGRERNARSRQWISDNISKAENKLIDLIDTIQSDEDRSISVYERFANNDGAFADLQDAISEYLAGAYSSPITQADTDMNYQRVYTMLSGSPMSLEEAEDFEI